MRRGDQLKVLLLALGAMTLQQTFVALGRNLPSIIAPAILAEMQMDAAWIGVYVGLGSLAALVFQLGCGSFIVRYGALRISQAALVMLALGLAAACSGWLALLAISAIIAGGGSAISTPASSHLLGRYALPRYAPLIFSIKQTAVPAGLLMAGLLGPLLTGIWGWRGALLAGAAGCLVFAILLQPMRAKFDGDRVQTRAFSLSDFGMTLGVETRDRELRALSMACFAFNGVQMVFIAFFVIYLTTLGYSLVTAGTVFSVAAFFAVPGRILWGWVGSVYTSPRTVLGWLALGMAGCSLLLGLTGPSWPLPLIALIAALLSVTALSWHGVLLAEAARLAPEGMRGSATGGVLSFGQTGALLVPLCYAALLGLTGTHAAGFLVSGLPPLLVGIVLLGRRGGRAAL